MTAQLILDNVVDFFCWLSWFGFENNIEVWGLFVVFVCLFVFAERTVGYDQSKHTVFHHPLF